MRGSLLGFLRSAAGHSWRESTGSRRSIATPKPPMIQTRVSQSGQLILQGPALRLAIAPFIETLRSAPTGVVICQVSQTSAGLRLWNLSSGTIEFCSTGSWGPDIEHKSLDDEHTFRPSQLKADRGDQRHHRKQCAQEQQPLPRSPAARRGSARPSSSRVRSSDCKPRSVGTSTVRPQTQVNRCPACAAVTSSFCPHSQGRRKEGMGGRD